uniref:Ig-like domain-containing protein n=1 Tax=Salarias fasciatus TaxID=181472 RepID=A0A672JPC9_SALFA
SAPAYCTATPEVNQRTLTLLFLSLGLQQVSGVFIYTAAEVEAVNGTDVKLKCKFSSMYPVSLESVSANWIFRPRESECEIECVFVFQLMYYHKKPYPILNGRFKKRVEWSGDVLEKDASITLKRVTPKFRGTYVCQVRNLPDIRGRDGEVVLRVVNKTSSNHVGFHSEQQFCSQSADSCLYRLQSSIILLMQRREIDSSYLARSLKIPQQ